MNRLKQHKLRKNLEDFSDKVYLAAALSNILCELTVDGPNITKLDKITLARTLCENLEDIKEDIVRIKTKLLGDY